MPVEAPALRPVGVPEADGTNFPERRTGKGIARIILARQSAHLHLVLFDRLAQRLAGIGVVNAFGVMEAGYGGDEVHPFTAPTVRPDTMYFCSTTAMIAVGTMYMTLAADI